MPDRVYCYLSEPWLGTEFGGLSRLWQAPDCLLNTHREVDPNWSKAVRAWHSSGGLTGLVREAHELHWIHRRLKGSVYNPQGTGLLFSSFLMSVDKKEVALIVTAAILGPRGIHRVGQK